MDRNREFIEKERQMVFNPMKISSTSNTVIEKNVSLCSFNLHFYQKWKKKNAVECIIHFQKERRSRHTHIYITTHIKMCLYILFKALERKQGIITWIACSE